MALYMIRDRVWTGSADSANKQNVEGHGIKVAVLLDGMKLPPGADILKIECKAWPWTPEDFRSITDFILSRIRSGLRLVILDRTGEGNSGALAALYLALFGYAWDEAWAAVLKINPRLSPELPFFEAARLFARENFAPIK